MLKSPCLKPAVEENLLFNDNLDSRGNHIGFVFVISAAAVFEILIVVLYLLGLC